MLHNFKQMFKESLINTGLCSFIQIKDGERNCVARQNKNFRAAHIQMMN